MCTTQVTSFLVLILSTVTFNLGELISMPQYPLSLINWGKLITSDLIVVILKM